jgi:hypothetical protein
MLISHPFMGLPSQSPRSFEHTIPPGPVLLAALELLATPLLLLLLPTPGPLLIWALELATVSPSWPPTPPAPLASSGLSES